MAKDINKKEKKQKDSEKTRRSINPFDVIIVLLVLCLLGTLAYRVYDGVKVENSEKESKYLVRFECDGVYNSLVNYLGENTAVYLQDGELLGYIYGGKDGGEGVRVIERMTDSPDNELPDAVEPEEDVSAGSETDEADTVEDIEAVGSVIYEKVKLGGTIRLNRSAVMVENGGYYNVGEINFAVGSIIEIHTEKAVFTVKIVSIESLE